MDDLNKVLARFDKRIQQKHLAGNRFVAVVFDDEAKSELADALAPLNLMTFITVASPMSVIADAPESTTDTVETIYSGVIDVRLMKPTGFGKVPNRQFFPRFVEVLRAMPYFEPVVLRKDMTVIDGEQRIAVAQELEIERLPAIVLNATELQGKFLRLVLNKSNEFQRWHWDDVDAFIEAHPGYLVQLEPLGMFGERVIPESSLAKSVVDYEIHDKSIGKTQQAAYKQEYGLAKWAKIARAEQAIIEEVKAERKIK